MNIYDIACMAGVSTATVSRVLNHSGRVSEASRKKVEDVIKREGYIPNAFAHSLTTKHSHTIGILCPVISDSNHAYPVSVLSLLLREKGFEILLINTASNAESKRPYFVSMINRQVDAAVVIGCSCTQEEEEDFRYAASRVPVFVLNGRIEGDNIFCTVCDEEKAACDVVHRFVQMGRSRILYLYDSETYSGRMKLTGYLNGMKLFSDAQPMAVQICSDGVSSFYKTVDTVQEMLQTNDFDAVLTADDSLAVGAAKALCAANRPQVPIVGFNNTILSRCATPELSSVDNRIKQQCELTVQTMLRVLDGKSSSPCITLDALLQERASLTNFVQSK